MNAFLKYSINFTIISILCFSCRDERMSPGKSANTSGEQEPLLLPYKPDWNRYYPLYYQSTEADHLWYFMEQPVMLEAEHKSSSSSTGHTEVDKVPE